MHSSFSLLNKKTHQMLTSFFFFLVNSFTRFNCPAHFNFCDGNIFQAGSQDFPKGEGGRGGGGGGGG